MIRERFPAASHNRARTRTGVRYVANTIEEVQKGLFGYRDNMRVEVETDIAVLQKPWRTFARLPLGRTVWP